MTLPTPDAQSSSSRPPLRRPAMHSPRHSMPVYQQHPSINLRPPTSSTARMASMSPTSPLTSRDNHPMIHEHALDFATHSWDLATGGLKTLTAKREVPLRPDRRTSEMALDESSTTRSFILILVILACVVLLLLGGGIVLFVMLQT